MLVISPPEEHQGPEVHASMVPPPRPSSARPVRGAMTESWLASTPPATLRFQDEAGHLVHARVLLL